MEDKKPDARAEKARMLVALLGADFAKGSKHPFFQQVTKQAVASEPSQKSPEEMSAALQGLVDALRDRKKDKPATEVPQKTAVLVNLEPPAAPVTDTPKASMSPKDRELAQQHPALIAQQLQKLDKYAQAQFLKALPRATARQITLYSLNLKDTDD